MSSSHPVSSSSPSSSLQSSQFDVIVTLSVSHHHRRRHHHSRRWERWVKAHAKGGKVTQKQGWGGQVTCKGIGGDVTFKDRGEEWELSYKLVTHRSHAQVDGLTLVRCRGYAGQAPTAVPIPFPQSTHTTDTMADQTQFSF